MPLAIDLTLASTLKSRSRSFEIVAIGTDKASVAAVLVFGSSRVFSLSRARYALFGWAVPCVFPSLCKFAATGCKTDASASGIRSIVARYNLSNTRLTSTRLMNINDDIWRESSLESIWQISSVTIEQRRKRYRQISRNRFFIWVSVFVPLTNTTTWARHEKNTISFAS